MHIISEKEVQILNSLNVSRETLDKLAKFTSILLQENQKINLISKSSEKDIWLRHIIDSAQLNKILTQDEIFDLGSGAGFPGIVLSIMGKKVNLIEKDFKKSAFLNKIIASLNLNARIYNADLKSLKLDEKPKLFTARAVSNLANLLKIFSEAKQLKNNSFCFLKGAKTNYEIQEAKQLFQFDYEAFDSITSTEGKILKIYSVKKCVK